MRIDFAAGAKPNNSLTIYVYKYIYIYIIYLS